MLHHSFLLKEKGELQSLWQLKHKAESLKTPKFDT